MIIASSVMSGLYLIKVARERVMICDELLVFCNMLKTDISTRRTPLEIFIAGLRDNPSFSHISFLNSDIFISDKQIRSPLKSDDNRRISEFLFSLGKYDTKAQINEIEFFSSYIEKRKDEYEEVCKSKSRLCFTLCLCVGCVISLMLV